MAIFKIEGADLQTVTCEMTPGDRVYGEAGHLLAMSDGLEMQTTTQGGFLSGLKRAISGSSFFVNEIVANQAGKALFASHTPGHIQELPVGAGQSWYCQPNSFLCCEHGVTVSAGMTQKLGAGLFGGTGFILQTLTGQGRAFVHLGGASHKFTLAPGETLRVETGALAAFSESITYDIQLVGGMKSILFSGEGVWFAHLTGPGDVYLQSLTLAKFAHSLIPYLPRVSESDTGTVAVGAIGGVLGALLHSGDNDD